MKDKKLKLDQQALAALRGARRKHQVAIAEAQAAGATFELAATRELAKLNRSVEDSAICLACGVVVARPKKGDKVSCDCPAEKQ